MVLEGKTISFLGDSITEGKGTTSVEKRFDSLIASRCRLKKVNNYGIGGTRIAYQRHPSAKARHDMDFCSRCFDIDRSSDVIVIFGGTNDYGHGDAPFGELTDTTRETFCGSVDYLCRTVRELYPSAICVFATPCRRKGDEGGSVSLSRPEDKPAIPLVSYVDAIITVAKRHGFAVLDLYRNLGINPNVKTDCDRYTVDGLHFNDAGHFAIANRMVNFLERL